jgi:enamine deaminase RidA (YjgF/YER057c/UK114 family)
MVRDRNVELVRVPALAQTAPYAYAAVAKCVPFVFTAGACPLDKDGIVVAPGDPRAQAERVMDNLVSALDAAGARLEDVVKTTIYVATRDRNDLVAVWEVVRRRFGEHDAPGTLVGVSVLGWPEQLVEVEAVAARP